MNVRIKLLHTAQHPHTAQRFYEGQKAALESFGIDAVDSIKNNWQNNPITYMLVCENALTGELCAGLRLDVVDPSHLIPLEEALLSLSPGILPRIHNESLWHLKD